MIRQSQEKDSVFVKRKLFIINKNYDYNENNRTQKTNPRRG